jgi:hypothetical protein
MASLLRWMLVTREPENAQGCVSCGDLAEVYAILDCADTPPSPEQLAAYDAAFQQLGVDRLSICTECRNFHGVAASRDPMVWLAEDARLLSVEEALRVLDGQ